MKDFAKLARDAKRNADYLRSCCDLVGIEGSIRRAQIRPVLDHVDAMSSALLSLTGEMPKSSGFIAQEDVERFFEGRIKFYAEMRDASPRRDDPLSLFNTMLNELAAYKTKLLAMAQPVSS